MPRYTKTGITYAQRVRDFGEKFVVHKKDRWAGTPFILEDWQWDNIILPIYGSVDRHGKRKYTQALIGLPRWGGKSEILALMVMYHLFVERVHEGEAYVVASNERQANIVFATVKRMIQANPRLSAACDIFKREIWVKETGCVFKALPADADSAQGFHPSFCAVDEVHVHKSHDLIEAMQSGMVARENPLLIAITTAGKERKGVLWEMLHGSDKRTAWAKQEGVYVYWVGASDGEDSSDPAVWRRVNPASWITDEMLRKQYEKLALHVFERYHLNKFAMSPGATAAVSPRGLAKCAKLPSSFDFAKPFAVGIDGAQSGDAFGIVCVQRDGEDYDFLEYVFDEPPEETGFYDLVQIEQLIAEIYAKNRPLIAIDPSRLLLLAQHLEQEYGVPLVAVKQDNKAMCAASSMLVNAVRSGHARLGGCPKLTEHIGNAVLIERQPFGSRLGSVGTGSSKQRIDAAIAAAIGMYGLETQEQIPSFAETGGVWTVSV